jgi:hypothetical protein
MRCARCLRPLLKACKTISTKAGDLHFGADCATKAGLRQRRQRASSSTRVERDPKTRDWVEEVHQGVLP